MSKIKLVNENGVIKGIDPSTGNEVPVEIDDLESNSLTTDESHTGKLHIPKASADFRTFVSNRAGEVIDLGGQTFEVSATWSPPDDTTIKNGVVKLADGADADLFYRKNPRDLVLENLVFDLNGSNQTADSGPTNNAYWEIEKDAGADADGGAGTEIRDCKWKNGSGRVTANTLMVSIHGDNIDIRNPTIRLGSQANISFDSREQMAIINPEIEGNNRIGFHGSDLKVIGGDIENNDVGALIDGSGAAAEGDMTFDGGLHIEDNRIGFYVSAAIATSNIINIGDVSIQGQDQRGVFVDTGGATSGKLRVVGASFKRNGLNSGGSYSHITLKDGDRVVLSDLSFTNRNGTDTDANYAINVSASAATETVIKNIDADPADFTGGDVVNDAGTRTMLPTGGENNGDPNTTGQWNGHAATAWQYDLLVWDYSTSSWTPYRSDGTGSWVAI